MIEYRPVPSQYGVSIDFKAAELEARQRYQQARARRVASAPGRVAGVPARGKDKDSAWSASAARRLRLAEAAAY